jgi:hypothetical protein
MMTRNHDAPRGPRHAGRARAALFICGSLNQTSQLRAVAREMPEFQAFFTPFYGAWWAELGRALGLLERTILGDAMRARCLDALRRAELAIDLGGRRAPYDLVVSCTDLLLPPNIRGRPLVIVQEGMTDPETIYSRAIARLRWFPAWTVGTTLTATRGAYDRFCCASPGYRDHFVARGAPAEKLRVTGIPNFDDCARRQRNAPASTARGFVLVCTSDLRETLRRDDRSAFLRSALRIAAGKPLHFKFHPNEDRARAAREVRAIVPDAIIHADEPTEALIADCDVLVTQFSSVAYVGLALGKQVHSHYDIAELKRLLPIQNGGSSAANIADVCRELLGMPTSGRATSQEVHTCAS